MDNRLKAAIIGYGYMGEIRRTVVESIPQLELIQICETNKNKLNGNVPFEVCRDPNQVINGPADIVFVCTPNNSIPEYVIQSLKAKKHVFCEKPPGRNLQDVLDIRNQEIKDTSLKLMFGFNHRFHPGILRAKSLIQSGRFGKILWLRGVYGKSGGSKYGESWRNAKEISGGGILLDQGIHMLDLFCNFCGDFEDVLGFSTNQYWKFEVEDNAMLILKNKNGQIAQLHSSATLWRHKFQIEIGLEKGYLTIQGLISKTGSYGRETLTIGKQQFEDETEALGNPSEEIIYFDKDLSWELEVKHFISAIEKNLPIVECSSEEAIRVMKLIDRVYRGEK